MFTCLVTRAFHLEAIEELSTTSFINALRRFMALRGQVVQFRSDRGTNFIGAVHELNIPSDLVEYKYQRNTWTKTMLHGFLILLMPLILVGHGKG